MSVDRPVDVPVLLEFLRTCRPLASLDAGQLARAAERATVRSYPAGELILDAFAPFERGLYIVWHGRASVWTDSDRIRELPTYPLGPGELFGYVATLLGENVGPRVEAAVDTDVVRLDPGLINPVFATPQGAQLLAGVIEQSRQQTASGGAPTYTLVDELIVSAPLLVEPAATIAQAAARMEVSGLPYVAVRQGGGYGVLTDAGIRRAVASSRPMSAPVTTVLQSAAPTVRLGASATEALIAVLEATGDVVLVTDRVGELRGAVVPRDFVVSPATAGASLHEQISRAATVADLADRYRLVPDLLRSLTSRGLAAGRVITVHSAIIDAAVRRAIELVAERYPELSADAFTWLSLGSNGRREAVLSSDIDAAASFHNDLDEADIDRYRPMLLEITQLLERIGLAHDRHGINPVQPKFARTHQAWARAARAWLNSPETDDAVIMTCMLVDGRPIHGDRGLPEVARIFSELRKHPRTMSVLLSASIAQSAKPTRWRARTVDLKAQFLLPIANIARWAALTVGSHVLPTDERLLAAAGSDMMSEADATALADTFEAIQGIRLATQIDQVTAGEKPTDVVRLEQLTPVDRAIVTEATKVVGSIQRRMRNQSRFVLN